jgi:excisionase family DNA binding protein
MTSPLPEGARGAPLTGLSAIEAILLEHIASLESELAEARPYVPKLPPPGWLRVAEVADKLGLTAVAVYKMARLGRIASTKIGGRLWIEQIEVRPPRKRYKRAD